jgi:signal transduction histidine kinase
VRFSITCQDLTRGRLAYGMDRFMRKRWIPQRFEITHILQYLTSIRDGYLTRPPGVEQTRPVFIIFPISTLSIITLVPFGIIALKKQNYTVGIFDLALAFLLTINLLHAQRYRNYDVNVRFGIMISALLLVYVFLTGGINGTGFVCYYAFPLIACFFLGSKRGAIATVLISLPVIALFLIKTPPPIFARYSFDFKLRFLFSFLVVSVFSYLFECAREKNREELRSAQSELEKQVEERTLALRQANQSLQTEISERHRAEEALEKKTEELARSNRDLEQFAYVASHDLQEPLRMVTSYVQLLARRYKGKLDSDADEFIVFAMDGAIRMWRLINDLLAYSRVRTESSELEPTDCEAVLHQSLDNLKVAIEENGAVVTHDALPTVTANSPQLMQLFQNLIGNAIKFRGSESPRIHVSAGRNGNGWTFSVRDNGIGIAPEYAKRIFILFQRLHSREKYAGTGIGLAICQKIVERHGGHIWVESELGRGATFYFTLPASEGDSAFS